MLKKVNSTVVIDIATCDSLIFRDLAQGLDMLCSTHWLMKIKINIAMKYRISTIYSA